MATEHQPREHDVICQRCGQDRTWNWDAICDACRARAAIARIRERMDELVAPE